MFVDTRFSHSWPLSHFPQISSEEIKRYESINMQVASLTNEQIYDFLLEILNHSPDSEPKYIDPANLTRPDEFGQTLLHVAAARGNLEITQFIIQVTGAQLFASPTYVQQYTPLHLAVHGGNNEVIKLLLDESEKQNLQDFVAALDAYGQTALHWAVSKGNLGGCKELYQAMSNKEIAIQMKDRSQTALHFAVQGNYYEIAELLLSKEGVADVLLGKVDKHGQSALHWAIAKPSDMGKKIVDLLAQKATSPDFFLMQTERGYTALHIGVHSSSNESINSLLKTTQNRVPGFASKIDIHGQTALHWAAGKGNEVVTRLLCKAMESADIDIQSENGKTALQLAAQAGHTEIVRLLMEYGADSSLPDSDEMTAADLVGKYLKKESKEAILPLLEKKST